MHRKLRQAAFHANLSMSRLAEIILTESPKIKALKEER